MKCDRAIKEYLNHEDNSSMPLMLRIHLLLCRRCRKEISGLIKIFSQLKNDSSFKIPFDITSPVMNIIRTQNIPEWKTISGAKWVSIGTVIFSSILLLNFSESFIWLKKEFGSYYTIPVSIVMGLVITAYFVILIACNYEYIKKYIGLHSRWKFK